MLLQSTAQLRDGVWLSERYQLTTPAGPRHTHDVSDQVIAIVSGCDGSAPLGKQLARLAGQLGVDREELQAAALPAVVRLVEQRIVEPTAAEMS